MVTYTTKQAAAKAGISRATLQVWIGSGKFRAPRVILRDGRGIRVWTEADLERLLAVKEKIYVRGPGRPKRR